MASVSPLPAPHLHARLFGARRLWALTDDALYRAVGVRIAFTSRWGGMSEGAFKGLNLGGQVGDNPQTVAANRNLLLQSMEASSQNLLLANQVHGTEVVEVCSSLPADLERARFLANNGADALIVGPPDVPALLCFADCLPLIIVSPTGRFALVHAGWRGAVAGIAYKVVLLLAASDEREQGVADCERYNAYIGPYIHQECFETSDQVTGRFVERFGKQVAHENCVNLAYAVSADLQRAGIDVKRIGNVNKCTACLCDEYYSYRASKGTCGRQGAFAVRGKGQKL